MCKLSSKNNTLQVHPHVLCEFEFLYTLQTTVVTTESSALVSQHGALYYFWHSFRKYLKHQADFQARNEQTEEPNSFCSERYEALVCCPRNVKHSLPISMTGAKVKGFGACFHSCRLLPARQSEGHYLLEKSQHTR